ncbi:MFS general substrate transporter [Russula earlei]|uniref:MFS general substrate transporter n=1 Tax=Russula earlei TaxID=71964 RepID=A0ACC0UGZ0_9AGAM|nr:MFS general substrate transporter [Russula earlei]
MSSPTTSGHDVTEETPLLSSGDTPPKPTPLPRSQLLVLFLVRLSDVITVSSINPYINQLISELKVVDGDVRKVGYYTGIIMSLYFSAEAVTVLQWNRLSDHIGRKPVLLLGVLGTIISITSFGLSRSFWALALCRCLHGALNGNIGVSKSILAELTDESNMARGFSLLPLVSVVGYSIGSFIGGILSCPQDRWPGLFTYHFWSEYRYFLPCLVVAAISLLHFIVAAISLKEDVEQPLPLRSLLTKPVLTSVANYGILALLDIAALTLIPLVWSTPIELGGLGLNPAAIGLWMSVYGAASAVCQFVFFPFAIARFGPRRVIITAVSTFIATFVLFPLENVVVRQASLRDKEAAVWPFIIVQLLMIAISDMGFSSVFMYISSAPPNKRSLGATNGLAQTVVSIQRAIGPAAATSLFAFSLENNIMGGNFTFAVLLLLVFVGLFVAVQLPNELWKHNDDDK